MTEGLRVLVVDDESLARSRLRTLLGDCRSPAAVVAGEAANATEAMEALRRGDFDAVLRWGSAFFIPLMLGFVFYYALCLLYTSPSPRDLSTSRMPSSA